MTKLNSILTGLVAAVGFTAAASAHAASYDAAYYSFANTATGFQSTKSRAEVRAEAVAAQLPRFEASYAAIADKVPGMSKTRAEVAAEAREALRLGLLPRSEYDIDVAM